MPLSMAGWMETVMTSMGRPPWRRPTSFVRRMQTALIFRSFRICTIVAINQAERGNGGAFQALSGRASWQHGRSLERERIAPHPCEDHGVFRAKVFFAGSRPPEGVRQRA